MPYRKFLSTSMPWTECSTSGWNWTPYSFFSGQAMAAVGQTAVFAVTVKPSGTCEM